jgi:hypothetical protein
MFFCISKEVEGLVISAIANVGRIVKPLLVCVKTEEENSLASLFCRIFHV